MYIIQRLITLKSQSPILSGDYILADYFLKSLDFLHAKTLSQFVSETGISKTTIIQFCKKGGFPGVSAFVDELAYEYKSFIADSQTDHHTELSSDLAVNEKAIELLCDALKQANNIYLYGKRGQVLSFDTVLKRPEILKKNIFFLNDWSFRDIDEKLSLCTEKDVLIMIDSDSSCYSYFDRFSFRALYFQKDNTHRLPLKKFFIGIQGAEVKPFHQIILPANMSEGSFVYLINIWNYISDHLTLEGNL